MKEVNENPRQQLVAPATEGIATVTLSVPEDDNCTYRFNCGSINSSIGGDEDVLF